MLVHRTPLPSPRPHHRFRSAGWGCAALLLMAGLASSTASAQTPRPERDAPAQPRRSATPPAAKPAPSAEGRAAGAAPKAAAAGPGGPQARLLETFGDWSAYATQSGRSKLCYALTQPKDRQPKSLNRDPGYLFVSFRPSENVRNEVAVMMGFPTKDGGAAEAVIGSTTYALITKDANAWVKNPAEEAQVIATMNRGQAVIVKAASARGNQSTDRYSLSGFGKALDRARKECS